MKLLFVRCNLSSKSGLMGTAIPVSLSNNLIQEIEP
mgnify:CR=1 FL=1